jgi:4-hydroxybenzoate polyprenyltransferase
VSKLLNNKVIAFLKLVRIENLIMIALTQILLRYFVLQKVLNQYGIALELNDTLFFLVVLSTVLIAAAGYIINDYFDMKTDLINHPETVVVGKIIKRRLAIILHITFTLVGVIIGMYAALKTGYLRLAIFHIVAAGLLWFYSTNFKRQLLIGNIVVSILTAAVAFMPFVYEMGLMQKIHPGFAQMNKDAVLSCFKITFIFSLFAFITSFAREMIKDMEDYKGDAATGGHTMPIVWGMHSSKLNVFFLIVISVILLLFVIYNTFKFYRIIINVNTIYIFLGLILPLTILALLTLKAKESKQFKNASLLLKLIMLTGLAYSFVFYFS